MAVYSAVPGDDGFDLEDTYKQDTQATVPRPKQKSIANYLLPLSIVLFVLSFLNLIAASWSRRISDRRCAAQTSIWSPALDAVEYVDYDFQNDFGSRSIYRGPPTMELENAWNDLIFQHAISIPESRLSSLNRTVDGSFEETPGGYSALVEVFHQLHCLNRIRQYTWLLSGNYRPPSTEADLDDPDADIPTIPNDFRTSTVANRMHADHCIETLRQTLMCHGDVTPVLIHVDPRNPLGKKADFSSHHRCRNFDKIREWADSNVGNL